MMADVRVLHQPVVYTAGAGAPADDKHAVSANEWPGCVSVHARWCGVEERVEVMVQLEARRDRPIGRDLNLERTRMEAEVHIAAAYSATLTSGRLVMSRHT
jgi:hypothetical protein